MLYPDGAAVRVHDLLRDRKPKAGVLTEALLGTIGVKAFKHFLKRIGLHTRAVIVDVNFNMALQPPAGDAHRASRRREGARILDQIVDDLTKAGVMSWDLKGPCTTAFETQRDAHTVVALHLVCHRDHGIEEPG